jgi:SagB-type dehydrogenase family enzyme
MNNKQRMFAKKPVAINLQLNAEWSADAATKSITFSSATTTRVLTDLSDSVYRALLELSTRSASEAQLEAVVDSNGSAIDLATLYYWLQRLIAAGFIHYRVEAHGESVAFIEPLSPAFCLKRAITSPDIRFKLSRFAYVRLDGTSLVIESPASLARVRVDMESLLVLCFLLARETSASELCRISTNVEQLDAALAALDYGGMLEIQPSDNTTITTHAYWDFHDLLFHSRSRPGRHRNSIGATFRFKAAIQPPPAVKPIQYGSARPLPVPDIDALRANDPPYYVVQERRISTRSFSDERLPIDALGEFLHRTSRILRIDSHRINSPLGSLTLESARRPYPASGGIYALELYLVLSKCDSLAHGLYYYDAHSHSLCMHETTSIGLQTLIDEVLWATGGSIPHMIMFLTGRYMLKAWKYSAISYSLLLKDVGVVFHNMYLAATAMGLGACAFGATDSDVFASITRVDCLAEPLIGEFIMGVPATRLATTYRRPSFDSGDPHQ